jgi:hypothetical protein
MLMAEARQHPDYAILADNRQLDYEPPVTEVIGIARAMFEQHRELLSRKMALVVRRGTQEQLGRIFAAMGNYFGIGLGVFTDADEAVAWLRSAQESSP